MSVQWFKVPPDIEGWHEEGYEIRKWMGTSLVEPPVMCRDCRDEQTANLIAAAPSLLEAAKSALARYPELYRLRDAIEQAEGRE